MNVAALLTLLLGGGAVATIGALFQGVRSLREGGKTREKDTITTLVDQRNQAVADRKDAMQDRAFNIDERDYWRNRAADLEYRLRKEGVVVEAALPPLPIVGASPAEIVKRKRGGRDDR